MIFMLIGQNFNLECFLCEKFNYKFEAFAFQTKNSNQFELKFNF